MNQRFSIPPEERSWAIIAHLSGLAGYIIIFAGIIVPIIIVFAKSESPVTSSIAKQALYLNIAVFLSGIPIFIMYLTFIGIPLALILSGVVFISAIALPVIGAIKAADGFYFKYPLVGRYPDTHSA